MSHSRLQRSSSKLLQRALHHSYIGWPSFDEEICHGEISHTLESGWFASQGPEMLGGVAGAALCCTALSQATRGRCGRKASTKSCCKNRLPCNECYGFSLINVVCWQNLKENASLLWQIESSAGSCLSAPFWICNQTKATKPFLITTSNVCALLAMFHFSEVTCEGVWPLPLIIPQHPFVSWVSPQPHQHPPKPVKLQLFKKKKKEKKDE